MSSFTRTPCGIHCQSSLKDISHYSIQVTTRHNNYIIHYVCLSDGSKCLGIIHRLLCYQKRHKIRLDYNWKELWNGNLIPTLVAMVTILRSSHKPSQVPVV
jgi:hypothetical protein